MKNGLPKSQLAFNGVDPLKVKGMYKATGTSAGAMKHPYQRAEFWANPTNHFWETDMYSESSKEYFRSCYGL